MLESTTLYYNGILVPVRTSFGLRQHGSKCTMYQCKVDVDMQNAVKSVLTDVLSVSPSSELASLLCSDKGLMLET